MQQANKDGAHKHDLSPDVLPQLKKLKLGETTGQSSSDSSVED